VNHSTFGQQLLGLTLRVNPWLWNPVQIKISTAVIINNFKLEIQNQSALFENNEGVRKARDIQFTPQIWNFSFTWEIAVYRFNDI